MKPSLPILLFSHCVYGVTFKKLLLHLRLQTFTPIFSSKSYTLDFYLKSRGKNKAMNKASRGYGIPVELIQILKDDSVKVLHSICQQIWKTQQWLHVSIHLFNKYVIPYDFPGIVLGRQDRQALCSHGADALVGERW